LRNTLLEAREREHVLGLKVKGGFGGSVGPEIVEKIEANLKRLSEDYETEKFMKRPVLEPGQDPSRNAAPDALPEYVRYLEKNLDFSLLRKGSRSAAIDPMFGPGGPIAEAVFRAIRPKTFPHIIRNRRDPLFGGGRPEPIEECLDELKREVLSSKSSAGFALDGDGDRLGVLDERARYLTPQQVCALLLYYQASQKKLKGKVVQTVSMGYLTERIAKEFNLPFEEVPVGFKHVAARMQAEEVVLGAEESGGYAFSRTRPKTPSKSVLPERDGLFSALLFQEMMAATGKKPSELLAQIEKHFGASAYLRNDLRLEKPIEDKAELIRKIQSHATEKHFGLKIREMKTQDGLKIVMEDGSWLLVRPSGTEPLIRAYAEFPDMNLTKKSLAKLCELLYNVVNK
jgi:phosphomannomutase